MIQDKAMKERRAYQRILARCPVRFKTERENVLVDGSSQDISDGGLGLFTRTRLETETQLEMWIEFSHRIKPLHISGRVVWAEQRRPILWRAGICFAGEAFVNVVKMLVNKKLDYKGEVSEDV